MGIIFTNKAYRVGHTSLGIVIPKNIVDKLDIRPGDMLELEIRRKI